jgi:hypothetical protein
MRRLALLCSGLLVLAACGEGPEAASSASSPGATTEIHTAAPVSAVSVLNDFYSDEPRTALPLKAPEGAIEDVATFLEVCSRAIVDMPAGIGEATRRGWTADPAVMAAAAVTGTVIMTPPEEQAGGQHMLQSARFDYPHVSGTSCFLNRYSDSVPEAFEFGAFRALPNTRGSEMVLPASMSGGRGGGGRGNYSFVTPEGDVVSITVTHAAHMLLQMNMSISRPRRPTPDAAAPKP